MTLAHKSLIDHIVIEPEQAVQRDTPEWEASDLKALVVLVKLLNPTYQSMNLHNHFQLRKQQSDFELETGGDPMAHLMRFEEFLPEDYVAMARIIEATSGVTLLDAKEMLRRKHEKLTRCDKKEAAFKASFLNVSLVLLIMAMVANGYNGRRNGNGNGGHGAWKNHTT
ncbi:uncharacterized protein PHALS_03356 [Plasmopara halstedii]|uniref:Uncharacterized protein n=1 Tax=Plasmopara halstedii TaxID=4781 RepID=A0A0P1A843_PLAHL|nr:uncharacterized protein PHALS_03356 [Plasmopara halstedii]CEG36688.1 hypothetical protein PHALS_03356 [Plasmopara halstedii]|eukprot:XP_024573057.1 hypothetical protein PHALS_03356 [Plasmopara halstedii]